MEKQQIEIYQSPDGAPQVEVRFEQDTLWLSQAQMAELFDKDVRTINEHVKNIYSERELEPSGATIWKFVHVTKMPSLNRSMFICLVMPFCLHYQYMVLIGTA